MPISCRALLASLVIAAPLAAQQRSPAPAAFKGVWEPFGASAAHMALVGNRLVVHLGRGMYGNGGARHQSNFTSRSTSRR